MVDNKKNECPIVGLRHDDDDENKKYPIDIEEYIRADWSRINIPHDLSKYSEQNSDTIENRIVEAWQEHNEKPCESPVQMPFKASIQEISEGPPLPSE